MPTFLVSCLLSYCISNNMPLEHQDKISFFLNIQIPQGTATEPKQRTWIPSLLLLSQLLTVNYTLPTKVKEVCVCFTLYPIWDFPTLLSPASLVCHQWMSHNPLTPPPLTAMYKIGAKLPFFGVFSQSIEILLPSNYQFSSNKLLKTYRFGRFVCWHTNEKLFLSSLY